MRLNVEIDPFSGFCGGVIRAVETAEKYLREHPGENLYSLGSIVHNEAELSRLSSLGLISLNDIAETPDGENHLLVRAHGEPPKTYRTAAAAGIELIDCTCPVVLKLQRDIREAWERLAPVGGKLLIFGKTGHAEVLGLLGQIEGNAIVIENLPMLEDYLASEALSLDKPLEIFSQTTKSPEGYLTICSYLRERMATSVPLTVHDTICRQVASRYTGLAEFAALHDVLIFVSGKSSSNGRVLSELCRSRNPRTYSVSEESEVDFSWFRDGDNVGVSGATSTPKWLLEKVAEHIEFFAR